MRPLLASLLDPFLDPLATKIFVRGGQKWVFKSVKKVVFSPPRSKRSRSGFFDPPRGRFSRIVDFKYEGYPILNYETNRKALENVFWGRIFDPFFGGQKGAPKTVQNGRFFSPVNGRSFRGEFFQICDLFFACKKIIAKFKNNSLPLKKNIFFELNLFSGRIFFPAEKYILITKKFFFLYGRGLYYGFLDFLPVFSGENHKESLIKPRPFLFGIHQTKLFFSGKSNASDKKLVSVTCRNVKKFAVKHNASAKNFLVRVTRRTKSW